MLKKKRRFQNIDWGDLAVATVVYSLIGTVITVFVYMFNLLFNEEHNHEANAYIDEVDALTEVLENKESLLIVNQDSVLAPIEPMIDYVDFRGLEFVASDDGKEVFAKLHNDDVAEILDHASEQKRRFQESKVDDYGFSFGGLLAPEKPDNKPQMLKLNL